MLNKAASGCVHLVGIKLHTDVVRDENKRRLFMSGSPCFMLFASEQDWANPKKQRDIVS